jgi:membrane fusion protein, multidrug efflux system
VVVALVMIAALPSGCDRGAAGEGEQVEELAQAVRVYTVSERPLRQSLRYVGTVEAARQITLSGQLAGTLASLAVIEGERVKAGQVLARIAAPEVAARSEQAGAEVRRAEADHAHLCAQAARDEALAAGGAIAAAELDASRARCDTSREALAAARARAAEIAATVARGVLRAPVDG